MNPKEFFQQLDACIAKYDLLCHPFYRAWAAGELTREDLQEYSRECLTIPSRTSKVRFRPGNSR